MNTTVFVTFWLIVLARVTDVTLDTIRTVAIVQGRRVFSAVLGFFEAIIYISVVAKVLLNMNHPVYVLAYGLGFASGTFLGITIEQRLAFGRQLVTFVTRKGMEMAHFLRADGHRVAEVTGHGQDGSLAILYVETPRRCARELICKASSADENCFCLVNDVRLARFALTRSNARPRLAKDSPKGGT